MQTLWRTSTPIFSCWLLLYFSLFLFLPLCAHVNTILFPPWEAILVLPWGQILCFEMQGNIFYVFIHAKWIILKLSTSGTHLRSDMAHNAKTHTYCWADLLHVLPFVSSTSCQINFFSLSVASMVAFQIIVNIYSWTGFSVQHVRWKKRFGKMFEVPIHRRREMLLFLFLFVVFACF